MEEEIVSLIHRAFASFGGKCKYRCNHCYTFIDKFNTYHTNSISGIISDLEIEEFNTIYISGYNENFIDPERGISLIEQLYQRFKCNILFTTRNVFDKSNIQRVSEINKKMAEEKRKLFACVSISAYDSYKKLEPNNIIPSPQERICFVKSLYQNQITTFLTLRPICPNIFIPTTEYIRILEQVGKECDGVISSGIVVNDEILNKLNGFPDDFQFTNSLIMPCLHQDNLFVKYVNVEKELATIKEKCKRVDVPFYSGSIEAIAEHSKAENYI